MGSPSFCFNDFGASMVYSKSLLKTVKLIVFLHYLSLNISKKLSTINDEVRHLWLQPVARSLASHSRARSQLAQACKER